MARTLSASCEISYLSATALYCEYEYEYQSAQSGERFFLSRYVCPGWEAARLILGTLTFRSRFVLRQRQADTEIDKQAVWGAGVEGDRQISRQAGGKKDRQTSLQTDSH